MKFKPSIPAVLAFFALMPTTSVHGAGLKEQVELENLIEQRVTYLVRAYDPLAMATVKLKLREISAPLPGSGLVIEKMVVGGEGGSLLKSSILSVSVEIRTALDPIPTWLEKEVSTAIGLSDVSVRVSVKAVESGRIPAMEKVFSSTHPSVWTQLERRWDDGQWPFNSSFLLKCIALVFFFSIGVSLFGSVMTAVMPQRKVVADISGSKTALDSANQPAVSHESIRRQSASIPQDQSHSRAVLESDPLIRELPTAALVYLFSDCYWCSQDGYAISLWKQLSATQRESLRSSWPLDKKYFEVIFDAVPAAHDFHQDPIYFEPNPFVNLDQKDLAVWLRKSPGSFRFVSPMRNQSLTLSFEERLGLMNSGGSVRAAAAPDQRSEKRLLVPSFRGVRLTVADEEFLFRSPEKITAEIRGRFRTLVWLALREPAYRQQVLSEFDAREIAEAWTGPEEVLAILEADLPEPKRDMLHAYRKSVSANRSCEAFILLSEAGLVSAADLSESESIAA